MKSSKLTKAKTAKQDEFYTQMIDIENELQYYTNHFKGKVIYCNCDDPKQSDFVKYFYENFEKLGLTKLISSCYVDNAIDLFNQNPTDKATYFEYSGIEDIELKPKFENIEVKPLKGDGDFRSYECIEFLKQSDIVVTNPPFSLFREFVPLLFQYNKKFLIIGNMNAITYKEIFPLIKSNQLWLGITYPKSFEQPDGSLKKFGNINWYTNVEHNIQNKKLTLTKTYYGNESDYPKYDNYDAINIDKTKDIPKDYKGLMGVPLSFLTKFNPEQFEILGSQRWDKSEIIERIYTGNKTVHTDKATLINGKETYDRIFIKHK